MLEKSKEEICGEIADKLADGTNPSFSKDYPKQNRRNVSDVLIEFFRDFEKKLDPPQTEDYGQFGSGCSKEGGCCF